MAYVLPAVKIAQEFRAALTTELPDLNAIIVGPQYEFLKYEDADDRATAFVEAYDKDNDTDILYPGLTPGAIVDLDSVKVIFDDLEAEYFSKETSDTTYQFRADVAEFNRISTTDWGASTEAGAAHTANSPDLIPIGGIYTGDLIDVTTDTYTVMITKAGAVGVAELSLSATSGVEEVENVVISAYDTYIKVGDLGVYLNFTQTGPVPTDFVLAQEWTFTADATTRRYFATTSNVEADLFERATAFKSRDVRAGDVVEISGLAGSPATTQTLRSTIKSVVQEQVSSTISGATGDVNNQTALTATVFPIDTTSNPTVVIAASGNSGNIDDLYVDAAAGGYVGDLADGILDDIYTVTVVRGGLPGAGVPPIVSIASASGTDDLATLEIDLAWAVAATDTTGPYAFGGRGLTLTWEDPAAAGSVFVIGDVWRVIVSSGFTVIQAESNHTGAVAPAVTGTSVNPFFPNDEYTGQLGTEYEVEVTRGGAFGTARVLITSSGVDSSGPTPIPEPIEGPIAVTGNLGNETGVNAPYVADAENHPSVLPVLAGEPFAGDTSDYQSHYIGPPEEYTVEVLRGGVIAHTTPASRPILKVTSASGNDDGAFTDLDAGEAAAVLAAGGFYAPALQALTMGGVTVTFAPGSTAVTGTGGFLAALNVGDLIRGSTDTNDDIGVVASIDSDLAITLENPYAGLATIDVLGATAFWTPTPIFVGKHGLQSRGIRMMFPARVGDYSIAAGGTTTIGFTFDYSGGGLVAFVPGETVLFSNADTATVVYATPGAAGTMSLTDLSAGFSVAQTVETITSGSISGVSGATVDGVHYVIQHNSVAPLGGVPPYAFSVSGATATALIDLAGVLTASVTSAALPSNPDVITPDGIAVVSAAVGSVVWLTSVIATPAALAFTGDATLTLGDTWTIEGNAIPVGTKGVYITFQKNAQAGFVAGDIWTIDAEPVRDGPATYLDLHDNIPADLLSEHTNLDTRFFLVQHDVEITQFRVEDPLTLNYDLTSTLVELTSDIRVVDSSWYDGAVGSTTVENCGQIIVPTGGTVDLVDIPVDAAQVYVTYRALRTDKSAAIFTVESTADILAQVGSIDVLNPIAYGLEVALENAPNKPIKYITLISDDATGYQRALNVTKYVDDVYAFVPLSQNAVVQSLFDTHVDLMSTKDENKWRIAFINRALIESDALYDDQLCPTDSGEVVDDWIATVTADPVTGAFTVVEAVNTDFITKGVVAGDLFRTNYSTDLTGSVVYESYVVASVVSQTVLKLRTGPAVAIAVPSKFELYRSLSTTQQAERIRDISTSYADRRVYNVWPDLVERSGVFVEGYYVCCALAGMVAAFPPHQGFTNLSVAGFENLERSFIYFTQDELNTIADGGTLIVTQSVVGGVPFVRHQLSTDTSSLFTRELSLTKNLDSISYYFKDLLSPIIGRYNVTPEALEVVRSTFEGGIEQLKSNRYPRIGPQLLGANITRLEQDSVLLDHVIVEIEPDLPVPFNFLDLTLVIGL